MSQNLLELVQSYFSGDMVRQTSTALGENESSVGKALRSIVPLVLGGLFARSQQPGGNAELFDLSRQAHSSGILGNMGSMVGGMGSSSTTVPASDGGLLNKGAEMLRSVFGSNYTSAVDGISQQAGVRNSTTSSLMGMATPVVLGLLGKHAADNNLDASSFGNYLSSQRGSIMGALGGLPGNIGSMLSSLGLGGAAASVGSAASATTNTIGNTVSAAANRTGDAARNTARDVEADTDSPNRWPWILLGLLALAAAFFFVRGCDREPAAAAPATTDMVADTATVAAAPVAAPAAPTGRYDEASGNYIYDTGANANIKLPDGTVLNVGAIHLKRGCITS